MEELNISLQDISIGGRYGHIVLNCQTIWYHMSFSVLYSSNIVCITPRFDAILSEKSGRGFSIELDKHWNDNSSIRSDLRVNPRWRKLMYDNYEGRKQT